MKSNAILCLVSLLAVFPFTQSTQAVQIQDMDRINNIVSQARGLADGVRQSNQGLPMPQAFQQSAPIQPFYNPFGQTQQVTSTVTSAIPVIHGTTSVAAADGTGVVVNDADIRINAGGHQFVVPRMAGGVSVSHGAPTNVIVPRSGTDIAGTVNAYRNFASAVKTFRTADFPGAAAHMQQVTLPSGKIALFDQFNSLVQFANADYDRAAEHAYTAAAHSQYWNWEQLRGYYGDPNIYAQQYQQLQTTVQAQDAEPSVRFLLGYHHLMLGHREAAVQEFETVLTELPNDPVTQSLLSISKQSPPQPVR